MIGGRWSKCRLLDVDGYFHDQVRMSDKILLSREDVKARLEKNFKVDKALYQVAKTKLTKTMKAKLLADRRYTSSLKDLNDKNLTEEFGLDRKELLRMKGFLDDMKGSFIFKNKPRNPYEDSDSPNAGSSIHVGFIRDVIKMMEQTKLDFYMNQGTCAIVSYMNWKETDRGTGEIKDSEFDTFEQLRNLPHGTLITVVDIHF